MGLLKNQRTIFLCLTILTGIIIFYPNLNFQEYLSQGDHGRDLYSFKKTFEGAIPYRDYWSQNGPLMPYYYSLFYHVFGVSIQSTLIGYNFLILVSGILVYFICACFIPPFMSYICASWYWAFRGTEFFYTYNHIGAICLMLATIYFLFQYIKTPENTFVYLGSLSLFLLILIRPSIGIGSLIAFVSSLCIIDYVRKDIKTKKNLLYIFVVAIVCSSTFLIYRLLTYNLPEYVASQDLSYWKSIKWDFIPIIFKFLITEVLSPLTETPLNKFLCVLMLLFTINAIKFLFGKKSDPPKEHQNLLLAFISLVIFLIFNFGEFFVTGLWFRYRWVISIFTIIIFFIFDSGLQGLRGLFRNLLCFVLLLISSLYIITFLNFIHLCKIPENQLKIGANNVYLTYNQQDWIKIVTEATEFIINNVSEKETFLAVPYDPIYYFLSNRDSTTRQLSVSPHLEKENDLLEEIKKNHVRYILYSNRGDEPFGDFGRTYGLQLAEYINKNFEIVRTIGNWDAPAAWITNHAVKILKRK